MSDSDAGDAGDGERPSMPVEPGTPTVENVAFFALGVVVAVLMLAQLVGF